MFCQNCGAKNKDEDIFCEACGSRLQKDDAPSQVQSQTQPQTAQPQPGTPFISPQLPAVPRQPMSKLTIVLLIEVIALIAAGICVSKIGKNAFSAERIAERYFVDVVNGDWEDAYSLLDIDESDFLNAQMLVSANEKEILGQVSNYRTDMDKSAADVTESQLGKEIMMVYRTKGDGTDSRYWIQLIRQNKKRYLIFDDWKVSTDYLIAKDVEIVVPKGASAVLDGIALDEKYKNNDDEGSHDHYIIPELFAGTHILDVSKDGYEQQSQEIRFDYDSEKQSVDTLELSSETVQALMAQAESDMQAILSGIAGQTAFSELPVAFTGDAQI